MTKQNIMVAIKLLIIFCAITGTFLLVNPRIAGRANFFGHVYSFM